MKKTTICLFLLFWLVYVQCERKLTAPEIIPTTVGKGPGGDNTLSSKIEWDGKPVTSVNLYIFNHKDYNDTLAYLYVNSTDGSFQITNLPADTMDIILQANHRNPTKKYNYIPNGGKYFSAILMEPRTLTIPEKWFFLVTRYNIDIKVVENWVNEVNCVIDTFWVREPSNEKIGLRWFKLIPQDNQSIGEKYDILIFRQFVIGFIEPNDIYFPLWKSLFKDNE